MRIAGPIRYHALEARRAYKPLLATSTIRVYGIVRWSKAHGGSAQHHQSFAHKKPQHRSLGIDLVAMQETERWALRGFFSIAISCC